MPTEMEMKLIYREYNIEPGHPRIAETEKEESGLLEVTKYLLEEVLQTCFLGQSQKSNPGLFISWHSAESNKIHQSADKIRKGRRSCSANYHVQHHQPV